MSVEARPALSVVVAASDSPEAVARCVASLGPSGTVEIVVVAATDRMAPFPIGEGNWWVAAAPGTSVPRLRRLGLDRARAPIVAFTEDSCRLAPGWADAWIEAFRDPATLTATGPVDHAASEGATARDWAVFFCEYAPFLGPARPGPVSRLAGNNFAARAETARALNVDDLQESALAREVGRTAAVAVGRAKAWHARRYSLREAIGDRLRFGLEFGRLRASRGRHPLVMVAGPMILLAQAARVTLATLASPRHRAKSLEVLPITLALLAAWSVGEWLGWLAGPPRRRGCT